MDSSDLSRWSKSIVQPVLLGLAASTSYSVFPFGSVAEAPYQASWVTTGILLFSALLQAIVEFREEVTHQ
jgi:hypothetical protein